MDKMKAKLVLAFLLGMATAFGIQRLMPPEDVNRCVLKHLQGAASAVVVLAACRGEIK